MSPDPGAWLERQIESLYEDESLRSELTDDEARVLLDWAGSRLRAAALAGARDAAYLDEQAGRVRRTTREVNRLTGEKDSLSDAEFSERLAALLPGAGPAGRLAPPARDLVEARRRLDRRELIGRLTALASEPPAIRGGSGRRRSSRGLRGTSTFSPLLAGAIIVFTLLVVVGVALLMWMQTAPAPATPAVQGTWYQLYFTSPRYPDNPSQRSGSLDEKLAAFIDTATSTVDLAIYQLDLENVTKALLNAKARGAAVRAVTDVDILDDPKENPSFKRLQGAGIAVVGGNTSGIMHNKFVVVDGKAVWTGSWNFTDNDTYRYDNNGIAIQSPELARNYTATFEKMWRDRRFAGSRKPGGTTAKLSIGGVAVENYFTPEDEATERIVARLKGAQQSIAFMAFSFTEDSIGDAVRARAKAGVKVRGVFERTGSETPASEYNRMRSAGLEVLQDGNPYLMHHKVFILDGKTVVFGSFNFSRNAQESNDENLLIVDDQTLAQAFTAEFERVLAQAKHPVSR